MLFSELKTLIDNKTPLNDCGIEVISYLPIVEKMIMIQGAGEGDNRIYGILDDCIKEDNGIFYVDKFALETSFVMTMINRYTNIEFDETQVDNTYYDYVVMNGIWDYIKERIPKKEYEQVDEFLYDSIREIKYKNNSIEAIIAKNLTRFIDIIDKRLPDGKEIKSMAKSLVKDINKMDWSKVPQLKQMYDYATSGKVDEK
jgi:hypothetical protein